MRYSTRARDRSSLGLALGLSIVLCSVEPAAAGPARRGGEQRDRPDAAGPQHSHPDPRPQRAWHPSSHRPHRGWHFGWRDAHSRPDFDAEAWCEALASREDRGSRSDRLDRDRLRRLFDCDAAVPEPEPDPGPSIPVAPPPLATLLDDAGMAVADIGRVDVDDLLIQVPSASAFVDPVVILGPATQHETDPGLARLDAVDSGGFQLGFVEWSHLDGVHVAESVSYLILAPGRHHMPDGSDWEVGRFEVGGAGAFFDQAFSTPFASPPTLFLTVQSRADEAPVVVRARGVSASGFQVAMQEEEGADGVHPAERIGYLAISSPAGSGSLFSSAGDLPYLTTSMIAGNPFTPILSGALALEEEASADAETSHLDETLSFLAVGPLVFAQVVSDAELDPVAIRRRMPEHEAELEWGTVAGLDHHWQTVPLARRYVDPIVVVGPVSRNGTNGGLARVQNVRADAFEMRFQEWAFLDGIHENKERAFYFVAERGVQAIGGLMLQADSLETSMNVADGLTDATLMLPFPAMPGVFASMSSVNDPAPATVRVSNRSTTGFRVALQAEEAATARHGVERIDWIAIQPGEGVTADGRTVRVFDTRIGGALRPVSLGTGLDGRFPSLLAQMNSLFGGDPATMRFTNLGPDSVEMLSQEEQSADVETSHVDEDVAVFVGE